MVWGCITSQGVGKLIRVTNRINSKEYCTTFLNGLFGTFEKYNMKPSEYFFMQDNATCHTSKETLGWLKDNNINLFYWPKNSPDLNPIENVWEYLEKTLKKYVSFDSADHLWKSL